MLAVARDIFLPYRYFFHWTATRLAVSVTMILATIVCSIPAFVLIVYGFQHFMPFFSESVWSQQDFMQMGIGLVIGDTTAIRHMMWSIFMVFIASYMWPLGDILIGSCLVVGVAVIFLPYGSALTMRICRSYLDRQPIAFGDIPYMSWRYISRYVSILGWMIVYYIVPFLVSVAIFLVSVLMLFPEGVALFQTWQHVDPQALMIFTMKVIIAVILVVLPCFIVGIRIGFAALLLMTDPVGHLRSGRQYVRESWRLTRGRIVRILLTMLPFVVVAYIIGNILYIMLVPSQDMPTSVFAPDFVAQMLQYVFASIIHSVVYNAVYWLLFGSMASMLFASVGRRVLGIGVAPVVVSAPAPEIASPQEESAEAPTPALEPIDAVQSTEEAPSEVVHEEEK